MKPTELERTKSAAAGHPLLALDAPLSAWPPSPAQVRERHQTTNARRARPWLPSHLPILLRMSRAALFALVGIAWCVRSLQSFADPAYTDPETVSDWFAVLSFSAALFAVAAALPLLAHYTGGGPAVVRVSLIPAAGAALAGLANVLEDALQLGFAFWLYVAGSAGTGLGLIAFTLAIAVAGRGRGRLLAAIPLGTLIGWSVFESGGGVLVLAAWLAAAAIAARATHRPTQAVPAST